MKNNLILCPIEAAVIFEKAAQDTIYPRGIAKAENPELAAELYQRLLRSISKAMAKTGDPAMVQGAHYLRYIAA